MRHEQFLVIGIFVLAIFGVLFSGSSDFFPLGFSFPTGNAVSLPDGMFVPSQQIVISPAIIQFPDDTQKPLSISVGNRNFIWHKYYLVGKNDQGQFQYEPHEFLPIANTLQNSGWISGSAAATLQLSRSSVLSSNNFVFVYSCNAGSQGFECNSNKWSYASFTAKTVDLSLSGAKFSPGGVAGAIASIDQLIDVEVTVNANNLQAKSLDDDLELQIDLENGPSQKSIASVTDVNGQSLTVTNGVVSLPVKLSAILAANGALKKIIRVRYSGLSRSIVIRSELKVDKTAGGVSEILVEDLDRANNVVSLILPPLTIQAPVGPPPVDYVIGPIGTILYPGPGTAGIPLTLSRINGIGDDQTNLNIQVDFDVGSTPNSRVLSARYMINSNNNNNNNIPTPLTKNAQGFYVLPKMFGTQTSVPLLFIVQYITGATFSIRAQVIPPSPDVLTTNNEVTGTAIITSSALPPNPADIVSPSVPIAIVLSTPTPASIVAAGTSTLTATITGLQSTQSSTVSWTAQANGQNFGTITSTTSSGSPATFTAPSSVSSTTTVMLRATVDSDATKVATISIIVNPPTGINPAILNGFGTGAAGNVVVSVPNTIINSYASVIQPVAASATSAVVDDVSGFSNGDEIIIIQIQGSSAGTVEFLHGIVVNTVAKTVGFQNGLLNVYPVSVTEKVQIVKVPNFDSLTINSGASITAPAWDGIKGGIVAYRAASGTILNGNIDVSGKGYRGGDNPGGPGGEGDRGRDGESHLGLGEVTNILNNAEGGGGGQKQGGCYGSGGGGGGYGSSGLNGLIAAAGGCEGGNGGSTIGTSDLSMIFFGAGGGAGGRYNIPGGLGGSGGGIIAIKSKTITGQGFLRSNGLNGQVSDTDNDAAGGGGAGGAIRIHTESSIDASQIDVTGGLGGSGPQTGGNGGEGRKTVSGAIVIPVVNVGNIGTFELNNPVPFRRDDRLPITTLPTGNTGFCSANLAVTFVPGLYGQAMQVKNGCMVYDPFSNQQTVYLYMKGKILVNFIGGAGSATGSITRMSTGCVTPLPGDFLAQCTNNQPIAEWELFKLMCFQNCQKLYIYPDNTVGMTLDEVSSIVLPPVPSAPSATPTGCTRNLYEPDKVCTPLNKFECCSVAGDRDYEYKCGVATSLIWGLQRTCAIGTCQNGRCPTV